MYKLLRNLSVEHRYAQNMSLCCGSESFKSWIKEFVVTPNIYFSEQSINLSLFEEPFLASHRPTSLILWTKWASDSL